MKVGVLGILLSGLVWSAVAFADPETSKPSSAVSADALFLHFQKEAADVLAPAPISPDLAIGSSAQAVAGADEHRRPNE